MLNLGERMVIINTVGLKGSGLKEKTCLSVYTNAVKFEENLRKL